MQTAPGQDAEFRFQPVGNFGVVLSDEIQRDNTDPVVKTLGAADCCAGDVPQSLQEPGAQSHFVGMERFQPLSLQKPHGCFQSVDAGQIGRSGLKTVGKIVRQIFGIRRAAGSAGNQGIQQLCEAILQQKNTDAGGAKQSLVTRGDQSGKLPLFKININMSGGLRHIQNEGNTCFCADFSHCFRILHRAADIAAVGHDDKLRIGTDQRPYIFGIHQTFPVALNPVEFHPGKLQQGTHHGIVLHGADDAVVAGLQQTLDNHIQSGGSAGGQDHMGGSFWKMEEFCQTFPQQQGNKPRILSSAVNAAVDGGTHRIHIFFHAGTDPIGFGE